MRQIIAILCALHFFSSAIYPADDKNKAKARRLFVQYQEEVASLPIKERIARLREITHLDHKFAGAYAALAETHLDAGTLDGRVKAIKNIKKAIRLEPENPKFRYLDGEICLQRDQLSHRTEMAKKAFEKAVELKPDYGEAHFQLGLLAEKSFLDYQNFVSPHADWTIRFTEFALNDALTAEQHFDKAIKYMKNPAPACYRLALLYFEFKLLDEMLVLLQRASQLEPAKSDYWLFSGLAYYYKNEPEKAHAQFQNARACMPQAMLAVFDSVEMVLAPKVAEQVQASEPGEKQQFAKRHWAKSDPLYLTAVNERLLEHYARVAYANLRFSIPHKNIPGYRTDPGKTLIRFGFPKAAMGTPFGMRSNMPPIDAGLQEVDLGISPTPFTETRDNTPGRIFRTTNARTANALQSLAVGTRQGAFGGAQVSVTQGTTMQIKSGQEIWQYDGFSIPFDRKMSGSYEFAWGVESADGRDIFNRVIRKTPELFDPVLPGQKMPLRVTTVCFKSELGGSEALIFTGIPKAHGDSIRSEYGFFVFDTLFHAMRDKIGTRILRQVVRQDTTELFLDQQLMVLPAGNYDYSMEILDLTDQRVGVFRDRLLVPDFSAPGLQMSDVLLTKTVTEKSGANVPFIYKGYSIVPAFSQVFEAGAKLHLYFEIYNLAMQVRRTNYRLEFSLSRPKDKRGGVSATISSLLETLNLKRDEPEMVTVSYSYSGDSHDERHGQSIDLANHDAGDWILTIRVVDVFGGDEIEMSQSFQIFVQEQ